MASKDNFKYLLGTIVNYFRIGFTGPRLKDNGGSLDVRNADDSAFVPVRVAAPVGDNDAVNKLYLDQATKPTLVARQADCTSAIPNNTSTRGMVVVTTAGTGAVIGDLLWDDGTATGVMTIIVAAARSIATTVALSGGTISFDADSIYVWDVEGGAWIKIGDIGSVTGAVRELRYVINNSATQDSTSQLPANARVISAKLEVTTPYSGGATISIGKAGSLTLLMATTENLPQAANSYEVEQDTSIGSSASTVRTTVAGSPAAGAGVVTILYVNPNA